MPNGPNQLADIEWFDDDLPQTRGAPIDHTLLRVPMESGHQFYRVFSEKLKGLRIKSELVHFQSSLFSFFMLFTHGTERDPLIIFLNKIKDLKTICL